MSDRLLTKRELADYLRVSLRAIEKWQARGMPCEKLGTACRYDVAAVLAWHRDHNQQRTRKNP
jgi:phage terminase Nu1 subunit (DNA packaging protein)